MNPPYLRPKLFAYANHMYGSATRAPSQSACNASDIKKKLDLRGFFFITRLRRLTIAAKHQVRSSQNTPAYPRLLRKPAQIGHFSKHNRNRIGATAKRLQSLNDSAAANHRIAHVGNERLTGSSRLGEVQRYAARTKPSASIESSAGIGDWR